MKIKNHFSLKYFLGLFLTAALLIGCVSCKQDTPALNTASPGNSNSDGIELMKDGTYTCLITYASGDTSSYKNAYKIKAILEEVTGKDLPLSAYPQEDMWTEDGDTNEILVGNTNRSQTPVCALQWREYAVEIVNNKLFIRGSNEEDYNAALLLFRQALEDNFDGSNLRLPKDLLLRGSSVPASGTYNGAYESTMDYLSRQSPDDFAAHCRALENDGCTEYFANKIGENQFVTYKKDDIYVHTYYTAYSGEIRTIYDRTSKTTFLTEKPIYSKITESCVTQMVLSYDVDSFGMCYVITLEDGSFIIIDGGYSLTSEVSGSDVTRLYNVLQQKNKRADGEIIIAAWILTHDHPDHFNVFHSFSEQYADKVHLEQLILNPQGETGSNYLSTGVVLEDLSKFGSSIPLYTPHTGQNFYIRNAHFEVLYTQEDLYPYPTDNLNNCSLVTRMTINGQSIFWSADLEIIASDVLCDMYDTYLKTDIVQMAHHGYLKSGTAEFYTKTDPSVILWPSMQGNFEHWTNVEPVNQFVLNDLNVQEVIVADGKTKTLYLPYTANSGELLEEDISGK